MLEFRVFKFDLAERYTSEQLCGFGREAPASARIDTVTVDIFIGVRVHPDRREREGRTNTEKCNLD